MSDKEQEIQEQEEQTPPEEPEVVIVDELPKEEKSEKPPEKDEEKETLRKRLSELEASRDPSKLIADGFAYLKDRLEAAGQPAPVPQQPGESDEEFWTRINEKLFDKDPSVALKQAVDRQARKLVRDELGPVILAQMEEAFENTEYRLRNDAQDGPIYRKYEDEVKRELRKLPALEQKNPAALKRIFREVKAGHLDDIIADRLEEERKKPSEPSAPAKQTSIRGRVEAGGPAPTPEKKRPYILRSEHERATRLGMKDSDYLDLKEYRKEKKA